MHLGVPITSFSADGYQSVDALQRISRMGIRTGRISVDQTSPNDPMAAYETLRAGINEGRFFFPKDDETTEDMKLLQIDYAKSRGIGKVDHLPGKKKDTADCLAAIAFHLTHAVSPWTMVDKVEGAGYAAAIATPSIGGTVTGIPYAGFSSAMDEIRYRRGMPVR